MGITETEDTEPAWSDEHATVAAVAPDRLLGLDLAQGIRMFTGLVWMGWGVPWWQSTGRSPLSPVMGMASIVGGLVIVVVSARHRPSATWRDVDLRIFVGTLVIIGLWLAADSVTHAYETDELTTGQASATLLINGHDPYGVDLTAALRPFNVSPLITTPIFGGGVVHTVSYPALSFLLYVPFGLLMGTAAPYAQVANGVAWILLMILVWRLVDDRVRPIVPLLASSTLYVAFVDGGVTDTLFLPFLCVALYKWDRFLLFSDARLTRWRGPICLGLACAVKPTPWLIAPFLVAAVAIEAMRRSVNPWRAVTAYAGLAIGAFLVVNGPFILLNARAWVNGAFLPLIQPLVPDGQGIVQLPLYMHIAGGDVSFLSVAAVGGLVSSLGVFVLRYPRTRRLLPLMAAVPVLLSSRSLINYFLYVPILTLVAASRTEDVVSVTARASRALARLGRSLAVFGALAAAAAVGAFLVHAAPLRLTVSGLSHRVSASGNATVAVTVVAVNLTGRPIHPVFGVTSGGFMDPAWRPESGPAVLGPNASATYTLVPTDPFTNLGAGTVYLVDGLASNPDSVSTSDWTTAS